MTGQTITGQTITGQTNETRVVVDQLTVQRGDATLVDEVSFHLKAGEILGLIGPNGAGKSTLLSCIAGIAPATAGSIVIDGIPLSDFSGNERARVIGWVEQLGSVYWPLTVERLVMLGRIPHLPSWSKVSEADYQAVETAMEQADCLTLRTRRVPSLSGGERTRVLLARALAAEPTLLFADEPVSTLDLKHQLQTMHVLHAFASEGNAAIVVMHDLSLAARFCDRLLLMDQGRLVACGEVAAVLSNRNIADVYGVSVSTGCEHVPWVIPRDIL